MEIPVSFQLLANHLTYTGNVGNLPKEAKGILMYMLKDLRVVGMTQLFLSAYRYLQC